MLGLSSIGRSKLLLSCCQFHRQSRLFSVSAEVRHDDATLGPKETTTTTTLAKKKLVDVKNGPGLEHFIANGRRSSVEERKAKRRTPEESHPYLSDEALRGDGLRVYLDVHGCQMNVNDTEVVWSILESRGYARTTNSREADVWLIVTCSIRDGAEQKIWRKLKNIKHWRKKQELRSSLKVGLLGCMAERLKEELLEAPERLVDVVAGPDAYRDLPRLLSLVTNKSMGTEAAINVLLSVEETYADVMPSRLDPSSVTGFVSIQRGCDNMCSYCIVPFTRGQERSRSVQTVVDEVKYLVEEQGVKEVTLLGQNVNSYRDTSQRTFSGTTTNYASGFSSVYKPKVGGLRFADLLERVATVDPEVRVRFTSPHPKDFPDEVLALVASTPNVCSQLHLPAQCGSSKVLEAMRRGYTRQAYLDLVQRVREMVPGVCLSGDMIAGFCGEAEEDFEQTLSLIRQVKYTNLFTFAYSLREKTHAHRKLVDDVPAETKQNRMERMAQVFREEAHQLNQKMVGTHQLVLIEGVSKRSDHDYQGRCDGNVKVILPNSNGDLEVGKYCVARIESANSQVLKGQVVDSCVKLQQFDQKNYESKAEAAAANELR